MKRSAVLQERISLFEEVQPISHTGLGFAATENVLRSLLLVGRKLVGEPIDRTDRQRRGGSAAEKLAAS